MYTLANVAASTVSPSFAYETAAVSVLSAVAVTVMVAAYSVLSYVTPSALPATCTSVYSYVPAASNGSWSKVTVPSAAFVVVPGIHHVRSRKENVSDLRDTVGATAYGHVGGNNDAGMLDLSTSKYKNPAELSTWGADATGPDLTTKGVGNFTQDDGIPLQVWDASDVTIGMPVCKSGSTSGWTCGVVTADKVTESVNDNGELLDVYGFHFSAFLLSGDSGGAIVSGHYAIGVDSYGNMSFCDDAADDDAVAGGFAIVDGKYNAEVMFKHGFNLSINVGQPKFAKLAAGQISGMVDAAAGAKVTVAVDGKSYVAIVGNAGAWTVRLPKALAPGSHKVTALASLQAKGSGFTTTGAAASRKFTL